jgi:signal transduction histidine kinase
MEQVLLNLIDNALRHNPEGTQVRVSTVVNEASVAISISDDGGGVPEDVAAAFFDPERRRRTETAGAGLGLSIASGIVEAHGGTIELAGSAGRGARLLVTIPIEGPGRTTTEAFGAAANA